MKAQYQLPLLAHATLEPQNCTADVRADGCDIYVPTQIQQFAQLAAAGAAGLKPEQVRVHTTFLGGGFGRRLDVDFIPAAAVEASKAVRQAGGSSLWTREDEHRTHDVYRPPAFDTAVVGAFDHSGRLSAWKLHLVGPSITARMFPAVVEKSIDPFAIEAAANVPVRPVPNVSGRLSAARNRHHRRLHAFGEPCAQLLRRRELHGRARRQRRQGSGGVSQDRCSAEASRATSGRWSLPPRKPAMAPRPGGTSTAWPSWRATAPTWPRSAQISLENGKVSKVHRIVCAVDWPDRS